MPAAGEARRATWRRYNAKVSARLAAARAERLGLSLPLAERFAQEVSPCPVTGCWWWTGGLNGSGYGQVSKRLGGESRAHRFSWTLYRGPIPSGMVVCHACDQRLCVNPSHLFVGTVADNNADMLRKGRDRHPTAEQMRAARARNPSWFVPRKLSDEDMAQIRRLRGSTTLEEIARRFGISASHVSRVSRGVR